MKAAVVDVESGRFRSVRLRVPTLQPATPEAVSDSMVRLVKRLAKATGISDATPVGVGLPGVAIDGRLTIAANIDPLWVDYPIAERLGKILKRKVRSSTTRTRRASPRCASARARASAASSSS